MKLLRKIKIYTFSILGAGLLFTSCADELLMETPVENGAPVDVQVSFSYPVPEEREVLTRAGDLNPQVYDLAVLAFDYNGNLLTRYFFSDIAEGITECATLYSTDDYGRLSLTEGSDSDGGLINMRVPSGSGYLMAVANINVKSHPILEDVMQVQTRGELLSILAHERHYDSEISTMGGAYMDSYSASMDTYNPEGRVEFKSGKLSGRIHLLPTMASVKVNINSKGSASKGGVFTLDSYELVNLPKQSRVFRMDANDPTNNENRLNTGQISVFDETLVNGATQYHFGFNMLEYIGRSENAVATYGQRAAWDSSEASSPTEKKFTNAPDGAPYLLIRGTYYGNSNYVDENGNQQSGNVSADVIYYVFLGHDSDKDFSDYRTLRNWEYTYNITVNGINEITVEVNKKEENRTDAEGDVLVMDTDSSHRFDSHFCQTSFSMTWDQIRNLYVNGRLGFRVVAPAYNVDATMFLERNSNSFNSTANAYNNQNSQGWGIYNDNGDLQSGSTQYWKKKGYMDLYNLACVAADWLKFYEHSEAQAAEEVPEHMSDKNQWKWVINYSNVYKSVNKDNNPKLLSIYRFLWRLAVIAKDTANKGKTYYFTVFAHENYYDNNWNDRMVMSHGTNGKSGNVNWSQFVNVSDRKVMLFPVTKVSDDGNSKYANPERVFAQRSIRTIYKPEAGYKAWGTESVEEFIQHPSTIPDWFKGQDWTAARRTIRIAQVNSSGTRSMFSEAKNTWFTTDEYGRVPAFNNLKGKSWDTYLNYNSKYENSLHYRISGDLRLNGHKGLDQQLVACLGRNRDLNGNGKIDAEEIRWYVPSIEQLQNLYIGNSGLPTEARIYQKEANEGKWVYKHYLSASRADGDATNTVLWAEEGPSTGLMGSSYAYAVHVRCVRDLGTDLSTAKDDVDWAPFMTHVKGGGIPNAGGYIEINKLNDNCVRYSLENKDLSGIVTTFANNTRPAAAFYYANRLINQGRTKDFTYKNDNGTITTHHVPDWTDPNIVQINDENKKSESTPQRQSLCAKTFGQGWRTPTISEVGLMFQCGVFTREDNILSRTRYVFWQETNRGGIDLITNKGNDTGGRDPHSFCEGQFRLRYPWVNIKVPTEKESNNVTQISGHYGSILCVKDKF